MGSKIAKNLGSFLVNIIKGTFYSAGFLGIITLGFIKGFGIDNPRIILIGYCALSLSIAWLLGIRAIIYKIKNPIFYGVINTILLNFLVHLMFADFRETEMPLMIFNIIVCAHGYRFSMNFVAKELKRKQRKGLTKELFFSVLVMSTGGHAIIYTIVWLIVVILYKLYVE